MSNVSDYLHSRYSGRVPPASGFLIGGMEAQILASMLNNENNSQLLNSEEFTSVYEYEDFDLSHIHWSKERMERIEPRTTPDEPYGFHGVLAYLHGSLTLLDGYHRTKWLLENGLTQGRYILIE